MVETTLIKASTADAAENVGAIAGHPNASDYVQEGLHFTPGWEDSGLNADQLAISTGVFCVLLDTATAEWRTEDENGNITNHAEERRLVLMKSQADAYSPSGANAPLSLGAGVNDIHASVNRGGGDAPILSAESDGATVPVDAIKIGEVDTDAETYAEERRAPSAVLETLELLGDLSVTGDVSLDSATVDTLAVANAIDAGNADATVDKLTANSAVDASDAALEIEQRTSTPTNPEGRVWIRTDL